MSHGRALVVVALVGCGRIGFDGQDAQATDAPSEILTLQARSNACAPCGSVDLVPSRDVTPGNLLIAMLYTCAPPDMGCPTPTITDTAGNTWGAPMIAGAVGEGANYVWHVCGALGGATTITVSNGGNYGLSLHVHEVAGIAASACLDATGSSSGIGATATVATTTAVSRPDAYVVAFFANNGDFGASSYVPGQGFSLATSSLNAFDDAAMSESATTKTGLSGLQVATATQSMPGAVWQATIATFVRP